MARRRLWDLFCRVVDNLGDVGVCWRLAADLAARGESVRLWIDEPAALAWMAPGGAAGVEVIAWTPEAPALEPGEVVIEAFGCNPPQAFVARMAARSAPPVWINLEHLSAEAYVERSHGLPSPQSTGPGRGLTKWFYFPGFTPATGGLLREEALLGARAGFDRAAWLARQGITLRPGERLVSLFCYANPALPALLEALGTEPTLLLLTPGHARAQVDGHPLPGALRTLALPWLTQRDYDRLLWSADLNFVRGEDSLVRAIWAGAPFVWQAYPQHDGAHEAKVEALLQAFLAAAGPTLDPAGAATVQGLWRRWNGFAGSDDGSGMTGMHGPWGESGHLAARTATPLTIPPDAPWRAAARRWCDHLATQTDLATGLQRFADLKR